MLSLSFILKLDVCLSIHKTLSISVWEDSQSSRLSCPVALTQLLDEDTVVFFKTLFTNVL